MTKSAIDGNEHESDISSGTNDCYTHSSPNAGHAEQYWIDTVVTWVPFFLVLAFVLLLSRKAMKRQYKYYAKYDMAVETQQKAYQELQSMNKLLGEIAQKLDKSIS